MANFFSARLFSKLRAFCIQWIRPIMPVWWQSKSLQLRVLENNQISSQHSSNNEGFEMWWQLVFWRSAHISSKLEHLSKVFIPTNQLENERCARRQFPSILSQTPPRLLGIAKHLSLWTWGLPCPVTINRRNFQTEIETEANKWSEFDGPVPSFSTGTVYGE